MTAFFALMRKDWRLNRVPIVFLLVVTAIPYVVAVFSSADPSNIIHPDVVFPGMKPRNDFWGWDYVLAAAEFDMVMVAVICAAFGGNAFATERRERSADFLALLPAPRQQIILSKLVVGLGIPLLAAASNHGIAIHALTKMHSYYHQPSPDAWRLAARVFAGDSDMAVLHYAASCMAIFSLGWLFSMILESAALAACGGLAAALAIGWIAGVALKTVQDQTIEMPLEVVLALSPALLLIVSSFYYTRRVAP